MAYLILDDDESYSGKKNDWENFFEFDSNDTSAVRRIHRILSLRKRSVFADSVNNLSDICESTMENNNDKKNTTMSGLFERAVKYFSNIRNSAKTRRNYPKKQNLNQCHFCKVKFHTFKA